VTDSITGIKFALKMFKYESTDKVTLIYKLNATVNLFQAKIEMELNIQSRIAHESIIKAYSLYIVSIVNRYILQMILLMKILQVTTSTLPSLRQL
jgi:hypothetical protein